MQEHVELEVSLEIIMARIAETIMNLNTPENIENEDSSLSELIDIQEEAYKGNRNAITRILNN